MDYNPKQLKYLHREQGEILITEIIEQLVSNSAEIVLQRHIKRKVVPHAVQTVLKHINSIVDYLFFARDEGEKIPESNSSWFIDEEPSPIPTDSWARGSIPVRPKPVIVPPTPLITTTETTPSSKLQAKKWTNLSTETKRSLATPLTVPPSPANKLSVSNITSAYRELRKLVISRQSEKPVEEESSSISLPTPKVVNTESIIKSKEQQEVEKLDKLKKDLKGKGYVWGANGEIIVINPVDPDRLNAPVRNAVKIIKKELQLAKPLKSRNGAMPSSFPKKEQEIKLTPKPTQEVKAFYWPSE